MTEWTKEHPRHQSRRLRLRQNRRKEWRRPRTTISSSRSSRIASSSTAAVRAATGTIAITGETADAIAISAGADAISGDSAIRRHDSQWLRSFPTAKPQAGMIPRGTAASFAAQRTAICPIHRTPTFRHIFRDSTICGAAIQSSQLPDGISADAQSSLKSPRSTGASRISHCAARISARSSHHTPSESSSWRQDGPPKAVPSSQEERSI